MTTTVGRNPVLKKVIHYGTAIGAMMFAVFSAFNDIYILLVYLLAGINIFNGAYVHVKHNWKYVILLIILSTAPVLIYLVLKYQ
ncbi:hypothetical protein [Sporosarcina sp. NPDC096371]|uniref:hypothetical protein n=1 Tax=Sporosarcina sp. NPDC096371 TaxID=3364530 RepID=UPI003801A39A